MELILTHNNADFDAVASLLAAYKLNSTAVPVLPLQLNRNVAEFVTLYQNGLPFVPWDDMPRNAIERITLVDTQRVPDARHLKTDVPTLMIDHHPPKHDLPDFVTFVGEEVGAATTLLVEQIQTEGIPLNSLEATLMTLGIYSDTGSLTYGSTTPRDFRAAAWLLEQGAVLDTVRRFLTSPLNDVQLALFDALLKRAESRDIQGYTVVIAATEMHEYVEQINSVTHRLRDMLDPVALFVVVKMPKRLQVVCRSRSDAVDVGEIARHFGGGGHTRAAAATIDRQMSLEEVVRALWERLEQSVRPITRVADLMSFGVQTVKADDYLKDIIQQLRRIGHEGYPVTDGERVVGLLTRRDADRALEHGLGNLTVRDVMYSGSVTLHPDDSVSVLEQRMVDTDWGQIPVVDDQERLLGIVTRTDLIKHWARVHPALPVPDDRIDADKIPQVLGKPVAQLIDSIARIARQQRLSLYMVGGVVRDLLLNRPNFDIDFVVESDAIQVAEQVCEMLGGDVSSYRPFGTAKWRLDGRVADYLRVDLADLPAHIDFATSRNEFYVHPTALPSVYSSSIKLDLHRRDFTINTLAVQLSPEMAANRLLDFYGGLSDLHNGLIRVLHSLSFVDDPTRMLRAIRFEQRLGFTIEPRTAELIDTARPMLRRITGERLRNELRLLLKEDEPERGLLVMQQRGILSAIHPAFVFDESAVEHLRAARRLAAGMLPVAVNDLAELYLHVLMAHVPVSGVTELCERLAYGRTLCSSFHAAAGLVQNPDGVADPYTPPSQVVRLLDGLPDMALLAAWISLDNVKRTHIEQYLSHWRHVRPFTNGHVLREMGLPPGPRFAVILQRLRDAWLDGELADANEERQLLLKLLEEPPGDSV